MPPNVFCARIQTVYRIIGESVHLSRQMSRYITSAVSHERAKDLRTNFRIVLIEHSPTPGRVWARVRINTTKLCSPRKAVEEKDTCMLKAFHSCIGGFDGTDSQRLMARDR